MLVALALLAANPRWSRQLVLEDNPAMNRFCFVFLGDGCFLARELLGSLSPAALVPSFGGCLESFRFLFLSFPETKSSKEDFLVLPACCEENEKVTSCPPSRGADGEKLAAEGLTSTGNCPWSGQVPGPWEEQET